MPALGSSFGLRIGIPIEGIMGFEYSGLPRIGTESIYRLLKPGGVSIHESRNAVRTHGITGLVNLSSAHYVSTAHTQTIL